MEQEIWKDIIGCEGAFQISNLGRIKSLPKIMPTPTTTFLKKEKIISPAFDGKHYLFTALLHRAVGLSKKPKVHRLVAEAFVSRPDGKNVVNHKNGNKLDNRASNLEWCTQKENIQHAVATGLIRKIGRGEHSGAKLVLDNQTGIFYECIADAADAKCYNHFTLCHKLNGNKRNNTSLILV